MSDAAIGSRSVASLDVPAVVWLGAIAAVGARDDGLVEVRGEVGHVGLELPDRVPEPGGDGFSGSLGGVSPERPGLLAGARRPAELVEQCLFVVVEQRFPFEVVVGGGLRGLVVEVAKALPVCGERRTVGVLTCGTGAVGAAVQVEDMDVLAGLGQEQGEVADALGVGEGDLFAVEGDLPRSALAVQ